LLPLGFIFSQQRQRTLVLGEGLIVRSDSGVAMAQCLGFPVVFGCSSSILINLRGHDERSLSERPLIRADKSSQILR
jgi:hypothetical protein